MPMDEAREAELQDLIERLDRLVPREGAHLAIPSDPERRATLGSRLGYLRFGVEVLAAALRPLPASEGAPARIEPQIDYLLSPGSEAPFALCEVDEAIGSRPPVRSGLGALGQLVAGVLAVGALILLFIGASVVFRWIFG